MVESYTSMHFNFYTLTTVVHDTSTLTKNRFGYIGSQMIQQRTRSAYTARFPRVLRKGQPRALTAVVVVVVTRSHDVGLSPAGKHQSVIRYCTPRRRTITGKFKQMPLHAPLRTKDSPSAVYCCYHHLTVHVTKCSRRHIHELHTTRIKQDGVMNNRVQQRIAFDVES